LKSSTVSDEVKLHLDEASGRITAIARAHQRLYKTEMFEKIDLGPYLEEICQSFAESLPDCALHVTVEGGIEIPLDQAIPAALFINELITNSAKYAHPNVKCEAWIGVTQSNSKVSISVRDEGIGLPADFETTSQKGLGMRLINAFSAQLGGDLEIRRHAPGVEFILVFPKLR
jgi:two-component sensor histidine kinase